MNTHHTSPAHHDAPHKQQFYLGFAAGAVVGLGIAYLSLHKQGGTIKKDLIQKAKELAQDLPDFLDHLSSDDESGIEKNLHDMEELITADPDVKVKPATARKVESTVTSTASKAKHFFTKAGRLLRKKVG